MKRTIDYFLLEWKERKHRKPLLLRGARQVGKTYAVRMLGKSFEEHVEINLELQHDARIIFEKDTDPKRIIQQLSELLQKEIHPQKTLLFFDEVQVVPNALLALRYFYEVMPEIHIIAAGSLVDFANEQVGLPVGRVSFLYLYPMSFLEFLVALGHNKWAQLIVNNSKDTVISEPLHEKLLYLVGVYLAIGGMPEAVCEWAENQTSWTTKRIQTELISSYQQDFGKYAKKHQIKYLNLLLQKGVNQLSKKFMYTKVGEYQKRELQPSLELLEMAGIIYKVIRSSAQGIPLGAQAFLDDFKLIFFDVGLCQALLQFDLTPWILDPLKTFVNKGEIVESFVGQEILAYSDPTTKNSLFYWRREQRNSQAEIDYAVQLKNHIVPIEVKSGKSKRIKSMQIFLESHPDTPYGLRFSADNADNHETVHNKVYSYALYAVVQPFFESNNATAIQEGLEWLVR